jgi:hypothetical protein
VRHGHTALVFSWNVFIGNAIANLQDDQPGEHCITTNRYYIIIKYFWRNGVMEYWNQNDDSSLFSAVLQYSSTPVLPDSYEPLTINFKTTFVLGIKI